MTPTEQLDELARGLLRTKHMGGDLAHHAMLDADPLELWERSLVLRRALEDALEHVSDIERHYSTLAASPIALALGLADGGSP